MTSIPITNSMVQGIILDLVTDYCANVGLELTAQMLEKERVTITTKSPESLFPTADVTKLEALIAQPLVSQIVAASEDDETNIAKRKFQFAGSSARDFTQSEGATATESTVPVDEDSEEEVPVLTPEELQVTDVDDEWSDDDSAGYYFTLVPDMKYSTMVRDGESVAEERTRFECYRNPKKNTSEIRYESYDLRIIQKLNHTGFEPTKDFPITPGTIIADRYRIEELLGQAAFSRAVMCTDLVTEKHVCVKIITNNKDFFDQSLDEIKLLKFLNRVGDPDQNCFLSLIDYFYHKEHLFIVCELLKDNLYEFYKYNFESGDEIYFTIPRLKLVTRQILTALKFVHNLNIIHCDLKPENILIKSYTKSQVKVIDFGSSCFTTDHLSSYVQSRSYRAPEVMLGLPYDTKVDMWSLGCILAELFTGTVLFLNDSIPTLLGRMIAVMGQFPKSMQKARYYRRYFSENNTLFERRPEGTAVYIHPKRTSLKHRIHTDDTLFLNFLERLLSLDPSKRLSAKEALHHPWLN